MGALFVAYFSGHLLGFTETDVFLEKTIAIATAKINDTFWMAFISGIGCNWLVSLGVWVSYSAEDTARENHWVAIPYYCIRRYWISARGCEYVCHSSSHICRCFYLGRLFWQFRSRFLR